METVQISVTVNGRQTGPHTVGEEEAPVAWHEYSWLQFGVRGGRVFAVRAVCNKFPASSSD